MAKTVKNSGQNYGYDGYYDFWQSWEKSEHLFVDSTNEELNLIAQKNTQLHNSNTQNPNKYDNKYYKYNTKKKSYEPHYGPFEIIIFFFAIIYAIISLFCENARKM